MTARKWPSMAYNPHGTDIDALPVVYGFNNGGDPGWLHAVALAEDGTELGGHVCSAEGFMPGDLGLVEGARADRQAAYRAHYPDGFRTEFVSHGDVPGHVGLQAAITLANAKVERSKDGER